MNKLNSANQLYTQLARALASCPEVTEDAALEIIEVFAMQRQDGYSIVERTIRTFSVERRAPFLKPTYAPVVF